jgi:hypothetical protein
MAFLVASGFLATRAGKKSKTGWLMFFIYPLISQPLFLRLSSRSRVVRSRCLLRLRHLKSET